MANKTFPNWLASLAQATVAPGDLIPVVQGGVSKQAPAGQAGGIATLDTNGRLAALRPIPIYLGAGTQVLIGNADGLILDGAIIIAPTSGNDPGVLIAQIYRRGTYNLIKADTTATAWVLGSTADPGSGAFRAWINGNTANAELVLANHATYFRRLVIFQLV